MAPTRRWFTVELADRMLPLVSRIARDIRADHVAWEAAVREAEALSAGVPSAADAERLRRAQRDAQRLAADLDACRAELAALGVECTSFADGHLAFPARRGDTEIRLSWRPGESAVRWWHPLATGLADRRPLDPGVEDYSAR